MRSVVFYVLATFIFSACIDDVDNVEERFPQQWNLVRMSDPNGHGFRTGNQLDWEEFYLLREDGSFLKSRLDDGVKTSVTGTYVFEETEDETLIILTFDEENEIISSCSAEPQETLIVANNNLLIGTWQACDGPLLEYFRIR